MRGLSNQNFGLLIAYVIPGMIALIAVGYVEPTARVWLSTASSGAGEPTVGGFLYVTLASVGLGMAASAIRFVVIDRLHAITGLKRPSWDESMLLSSLPAFESLVEYHYRHYQFYANSLISLIAWYAARRYTLGLERFPDGSELGLLLIGYVFWVMSRDTLRNYYQRSARLLNESRS